MSDLTEDDAVKFLDSYREYVEGYWGPRCSDYEPDCWCCKAWSRYDKECAAVRYTLIGRTLDVS